MSCRIIGRKIEYVLMDFLIDDLKNQKIDCLKAQYIETKKNSQVKPFYKNCSFKSLKKENANRYNLNLNKYIKNNINYINTINNGK